MQTTFHDAIIRLCPLLAFVVAPPGLIGGILMVMAGNLSEYWHPPQFGEARLETMWKQWDAGERTGTAENTLKH